MNISIEEIEKAIKETLKEAMVLDSSSVYEGIEGSENLKLVIFFNKLFNKSTSVLYTKLIFIVNQEKTKILNNSFSYLYDINCIYKGVEFEDTNDFKKKLNSIFKNEKFGKNILILSEFVKSPSLKINDWFKENKITELSVVGLKYEPKVKIIPCDSLSFSFNMDLNNNENVELIITKEKQGKFIYNFKIHNDTINVEKNNLTDLVSIIGSTLKQKYIG